MSLGTSLRFLYVVTQTLGGILIEFMELHAAGCTATLQAMLKSGREHSYSMLALLTRDTLVLDPRFPTVVHDILSVVVVGLMDLP